MGSVPGHQLACAAAAFGTASATQRATRVAGRRGGYDQLRRGCGDVSAATTCRLIVCEWGPSCVRPLHRTRAPCGPAASLAKLMKRTETTARRPQDGPLSTFDSSGICNRVQPVAEAARVGPVASGSARIILVLVAGGSLRRGVRHISITNGAVSSSLCACLRAYPWGVRVGALTKSRKYLHCVCRILTTNVAASSNVFACLHAHPWGVRVGELTKSSKYPHRSNVPPLDVPVSSFPPFSFAFCCCCW